MADHTFPTDKSSAGCSDVYLTDSRKAEALVTTSASSSVENSRAVFGNLSDIKVPNWWTVPV